MKKIVLPSLQHAPPAFALFSALADTDAWLKDIECRYVCASQSLLEDTSYSLQDLQIKTDFDFFPAHLAREYHKEDQRVLAGESVIDRLELMNHLDLAVGWHSISKWPVYDCEDSIIGIFGTIKFLDKADRASTSFRDLNAPIEYIRQRFAEPITVTQLAAASHLSVSALERRFNKHLSKTPRQYITEIRLSYARQQLLESNQNLASIAVASGFSDHSHFTRAYTKRFGVTPSNDRKQIVKQFPVE
ncbi:MAG: helix-turn-helix domain-containing protein [Halioglobus sp.]